MANAKKASSELLADQQHRVPPLAGRADEEVPAVALEEHLTAALVEERLGELDVAGVGLRPGDRRRRSEFRGCGVVGLLAEPQEVEHDDRSGDAAAQQCRPGFLGWLEVRLRHPRHYAFAT